MPSAAIAYWYSEASLRHDGGGLRALAWKLALEELGYDVVIHGLWTIGGGLAKGGRLSAAKRALLPMPLSRSLPLGVESADVVVATVPAVVGDALRKVPRQRLVLDWMDLWSVNARNLGDARRASLVGGRLQSRMWARRERRWIPRAGANVFAGYEDFTRLGSLTGIQGAWLPTPVPYRGRSQGGGRIEAVGFIGNLDYPPNLLSLQYFLQTYASAVRSRGIRIVVAGYGSDVVRNWGHPVEVMGEVDDVASFYARIDAAIIPVDHGGGIKVKAVEAMSFGIPVFGTEHVRSGLSPEFRPYVLDVGLLLDGAIPTVVPQVERALFEGAFSQAAFARGVGDQLAIASGSGAIAG